MKNNNQFLSGKMKHVLALCYIGVALACVFTLSSFAQASIGSATIQQTVEAYVHDELSTDTAFTGRIQVRAAQLDSRLRLNDCSHSLHLRMNQQTRNKGNVSVKVACASPSPWSIFVPVRIQHILPVVSTALPVNRAQELTANDITLQEKDVMALSKGYFTSIDQAIGLVTRRTLPAGTTVNTSNIQQPQLVKKGNQVIIRAKAGSVAVQANGTALQNGSLGDQIRVENSQSKQEVKASIIGRNLVEVVM